MDNVMNLVVDHVGNTDCLAFTLEHGCIADDYMLSGAINKGHLACVELMVGQRPPDEPYFHTYTYLPGYGAGAPIIPRAGPMQLRGFQHIIDQEHPIHPGTLIVAAGNGDVDLLRFLHTRGAPLWDQAGEDAAEEPNSSGQDCSCISCDPYHLASMGRVALLCKPEDANRMWQSLRYGGFMGAPWSPAMEEMFRAQRRSTRAVLLCFHVATRLSQGWGVAAQRAAWSGMRHVPMELIEEILVLAELEIPESIRRALPRKQWVGEAVVVQEAVEV
jgi:hypothetical protein